MRSFVLAALALFAPTVAAAQVATDSARQVEVIEVIRGFHDALAAGDSAAALRRLHPDAIIYESGHAETRAEYRAGHLSADIAFARAVRRVVTDEDITVWGDVALYTSASRTTGEWRGRDIDAHGAETIVLVRTPEGWRIRHIHWSSSG